MRQTDGRVPKSFLAEAVPAAMWSKRKSISASFEAEGNRIAGETALTYVC